MSPLQTFAFVHPLSAPQLHVFQDAFPDVEFLSTDSGLPRGIERAQAAAIHWAAPPIEKLLSSARELRWLHLRGAGIDRISIPQLVNSDIVLTNGSGNHAPNIAEHVLALMLGFARQLPKLIRAQAMREWSPPNASEVFEVAGQHLLIVGLGAIGEELARRAAALGLHVTGVRTKASEPPTGVDAVLPLQALDDALQRADHVVLALPLTAATRGILSAARISRMKPGAFVYNIGRGALIDHAALLDALRAGHLAGAGLDVTDPEPLPPDSPLWCERNVVITSHSAGLTPHSYARFESLLLQNIARFIDSRPLLNVVDKQAGY